MVATHNFAANNLTGFLSFNTHEYPLTISVAIPLFI
jgi:hypothetical protein